MIFLPKQLFMVENHVFWRRYIEISHSGEEQIPDPIYRGSDFQYTMPLEKSKNLELVVHCLSAFST